MSDFDDCPFSLPQLGKCMDFLKFFFTSEDNMLETTSWQAFTRIEWLQWEWFSFKVSLWFTKRSHFVWSV